MKNLFMSCYDIVNTMFEHDKTKLLFMKMTSEAMRSPEEQGTAIYLYIVIPMAHFYPPGLPEGGSGMLSVALGRCLEANGGIIKLNSEVKKIKVVGGEAKSVILASGEEIVAKRAVVANLDARIVFPDMVSEVSDELVEKVKDIRDSSYAGLMQHIALNEAPKWKAGEEVNKAFNVEPVPWMEDYRRMFDDIRYGIPPALDRLSPLVNCQSLFDPTRAPEGKHVLYLWHFHPWSLKDGGPNKWDDIKEEVADRVLEGVRNLTTNMGPENIIARKIHSPRDYPRMNPNLVNGGVIGPGAFMYQFLSHRPIPELGQYRTPIKNLYMSGMSYHPGGGISCGGRAMVQILMADMGIDFVKTIS